MRPLRLAAAPLLLLAACRGGGAPTPDADRPSAQGILPTGRALDPHGARTAIPAMPLNALAAPGGRAAVLVHSGWRFQGLTVLAADGSMRQRLELPAAFVGAAFASDGRTLWVSGGDGDVVYRLAWEADTARLADSIVLAPRAKPADHGTRYPAGLALAPDGATLYVAENLGDALAVVDPASGTVRQRLATGRYPYAVVVTARHVVVSVWNADHVLAFPRRADGGLDAPARWPAGRHPSVMLHDPEGGRLFVTSGSTDRVTVLDAATGATVAILDDRAPEGPAEGVTPSALALSADGRTLFVAEADANAVAVFSLSAATAGRGTGGTDARLGRLPTEWYPSALLRLGDTLVVATGKGRGSAPNAADGPGPQVSRERQGGREAAGYTLAQLTGSALRVPLADLAGARLAALDARVRRANRWDAPTPVARGYPPITHVVYVIKENRTYDQVFGDLAAGDGDTALTYFPRAVTPNHHALAERFGLYDRFLVNAEVSPDGHNWSTAAYTTDYLQRTVPSNYGGRGRTYDYEGTNRGFGAGNVPEDDIAEPARGYLWDAALRAGRSLRNYGEFVVGERMAGARLPAAYRGTKPALRANTCDSFPAYDLDIPDQRRADVWIAELRAFEARGAMPDLMIVRLPNDHTSGLRAGAPTPRAQVADNDLALGRMVEALSRTRFWDSTAVFVVEDDAQNGPDHVDSHRAPFLLISPWAKPGTWHRFTNTTDVLRTIEALLGLEPLSQFDHYGRPLRDVWRDVPDRRPYVALAPAVDLTERNPARGVGARLSRGLELEVEDQAEETLFNRVLWLAAKGSDRPMPAPRRMPMRDMLEALGAR